MQVIEIKKRIKVRADFGADGKIVPLMFKRGQEEPLRVKKVNATWEDREGGALYFSVSAEKSDDVFQLCYRLRERTWWMDAVMMEG
jgi:hypothetical protein